MVLRVPFDQFAKVARSEVPDLSTVYVDTAPGSTVVTAGDPRTGVIVQCFSDAPVSQVEGDLRGDGLKVARGRWSETGGDPVISEAVPYISAVAYRAAGDQPGIWVDASVNEPAAADVLGTMIEEFQAEGALGEATVNDFVKIAHPNVLILTPAEVRALLNRHLPQ